jgi:hypothetical protein
MDAIGQIVGSASSDRPIAVSTEQTRENAIYEWGSLCLGHRRRGTLARTGSRPRDLPPAGTHAIRSGARFHHLAVHLI